MPPPARIRLLGLALQIQALERLRRQRASRRTTLLTWRPPTCDPQIFQPQLPSAPCSPFLPYMNRGEQRNDGQILPGVETSYPS
eukprot:5277780-Pyramimonas_sp.AAC.1